MKQQRPPWIASSRGILAASILTLLPRAYSATETWKTFTTDINNWSLGTNWLDGTAPSAIDPTLDLIFPGGGGAYVSNNDFTSALLNTLTFQGVATDTITIQGNTLDFQTDDTGPQIRQNGAAAVTITAPLNLNADLNLGGSGIGTVSIEGSIGGIGGLNFTAGNWKLAAPFNSISGGVTIGAGTFVNLAPAGFSPQSVSLQTGAGPLGSGTLTINGGTLKVTTLGSGSINVGRTITFGAGGGILDLTNTNADSPTTQGGNIAGGDLTLDLQNIAANPAIIRWNGGQLGLSNNTSNDGNIGTGTNALRFATLSGSGPLRIEVSNGGVIRGSTGNSGTINNPTTIRGPQGGDPTSGPNGTVNSGISLTNGRYALDNQATTNFTQGITFEGALQVTTVGATRALDGSIVVAGTAGGNPGYVAFSGRGTNTQISSTVNAPGGTGAGQNPLWLGQGQNDTFTVQDGGAAVFDARIRTDTGGTNGNGVLLDGTAVLNPGATLRIQQSISNFTPGIAGNTGNVGDIVIRGDIRGEGTTAKEALLEIALPAPEAGALVPTGIPATLTGTATVAGERPYGGLRFEDTTGVADLIINGTGYGGLRVNGIPRPNALIQNGTADPVTNAAKLNGAFPAARLARVTGTGGYLTMAPANETYIFPAGGMWSDPDVGLKAVNHNPTGADLSLSAVGSWSRNLAVDTGATIDIGAANPFVMNGGTLNGVGTVSGTGLLRLESAAALAPGLDNIGTLTLSTGLQLLGGYQVQVAPTSADVINVAGNLTLGGPINFAGTFGTSDVVIANYTGTLAGTFSSIGGLHPDFVIDYGAGTNSVIKLKYTQLPTLTWQGSPTATWSVNGGNWQGGALFVDGNKVLFDDTATGSTTVTISGGNVSPSLVTFNNTTKSYTLNASASNSIVGAAQLVKNGTGSLTISGPTNYGGGTQVNAGTLKIGAPNSLPNTGAMTVASGATLDTQGNDDTLGTLSVDGSVLGAAATLTVSGLDLGSGAVFQPKLGLNGKLTKTGTLSTALAGSIDLGGGNRIVDVSSATAPELTLNGVVSNGGLTKNGTGTLALSNAANTFTGGMTVNAGTLLLGSAGSFLPANALTVNGGVFDANNATIAISSISGTGGTVALGTGSLTINQTINTAYSGSISGGPTSTVTKTGNGILTLTGNSTFGGGLLIQSGRLAASGGGAGTGGATVPAGAGLQLVGNLTGAVTLSGGTLSVAVDTTNAISGDLRITADSTVHLYDENAPATTGDFIFLGTLRGSGNLSVSASNSVAGADGADAFRLRGTGASDYTGTITVAQRTKFELQSGPAGDFSPMGTGKLIMTAGTATGGLNGTYSQFQTRVNTAGATTNFNNSFEITGSGIVNFNIIGGADTTSVMGDLKIGSGQSAFFNKNDATNRTVIFPTVTLTGGNPVFSVFDPSFGSTNATSIGPNVQLGSIGQTQPNSGIVVKSSAATGATAFPIPHVTITGVSTYTGTTDIQNGTLSVGTSGSVASSSQIALSTVTSKFDVTQAPSGYAIPAAQKLTGIGDWDGRIILDGALAPGDMIGAPSTIGAITGDDLTFNGPGIMRFDLSSFDNSSDRLTLTGGLEKGSAGNFKFDFANTGANNQTYTLVQFLSTTFAASDFTYVNLTPGIIGTFVLTGTDLQFVTIPEPGALASLAGGVGLLIGLRRFRRAIG